MDKSMTLTDLQSKVDNWIREHGVRYFDVKTNTLILTEELGEFARIIARSFGEQSYKEDTSEEQIQESLKEELADILFVLTCLANQLGIDMEEAMNSNLNKKTKRDHERHHKNPKLK